MRLVTLTTDFGDGDNFAGVMEGVVATRAPGARVVHLTRGLAPGDLAGAAFSLLTAVPYFPAGTVHVVVVDPGVGTARRPVAVRCRGWFAVGPDNGVLSWAVGSRPHRAVVLANPAHRLRPVSRTFHGRDVFAPAAAALARGLPLARLGPPAGALTRLPFPPVRRAGRGLRGACLLADRFGNVVTNLAERDCVARWGRRALVASAGGARFPVRDAYGEAGPGRPVAVFGSAGFLELSVRDGDAARTRRLRRGSPVRVEPA